MKYKSVKGMEDILPQDVQVWQELERVARGELESSGFREIRTPILEETPVFTRSIGETSDIVTKEMFTFIDKGERSLTLRPESTASIVRSYIEHSLDKTFSEGEGRFYYIGPMFRSEKPQKGRLRQFHQIGVEVIGSRDCQVDWEIIAQLDKMLRAFGLEGFSTKLNTLGCKNDKAKFTQNLQNYLKNERNKLCEDCKNRMDRNVLRVLDCKNETCIRVAKNAPNIIDSLCRDCALHFASVKAMLKGAGINFVESKNLVRGLDYYTGTIFEVTHPNLGGQDALAAGGRYDNLVKDMGGPDVGAMGYAIGIERVIIALAGKTAGTLRPDVVYFASLGNESKIRGIKLADELKKRHNTPYRLKIITLNGGVGGASLKSQMRSADKNGARLVVIIGDDEIRQGAAVVRDMKTKEQMTIKFDDMASALEEKLELKR